MINSYMSSNSLTLISLNTYSGGGAASTLTGEKVKGDGYYGRTDGLHTIQTNTTGFTGKITLQGTLELNPEEGDWSTITIADSNKTVLGTVDTTGAVTQSGGSSVSLLELENETGSLNYNFTGNYVWVRAKITDWTQGVINSVMMNN